MPAPLLTNIVSIAGSDKDVEQAANGTMSFTSTDLELVRDEGTGAGDQTIGLRFENLPLPVGAQILSANIQFSTDETNSEPTTLTIHAHRSGNAAAFTTNANDLTTRPLTLNSERGHPRRGTPSGNGPPRNERRIWRDGWRSGGACRAGRAATRWFSSSVAR